jgi:hypothetical protein
MILFRSNGASVAAALRQIARDNPREFPQVLKTVGMGLKKKMKAALPKGMMPLRFLPWNSFTRLLKARRNSKRSATITNWKAYLKRNKAALTDDRRKTVKSYITKHRRKIRASDKRGFGGMLSDVLWYGKQGRESVYVGFRNDKLAQYAQSFQSAENRTLTKAERHFRHKIQGKNIDGTYNRPARQIMKPFSNDKATQAYIVDVAKKRLQSIISKAASTVKPVTA